MHGNAGFSLENSLIRKHGKTLQKSHKSHTITGNHHDDGLKEFMQPYLKQYINEVLAEQYQLAAMQAEQDAREAARQDRELAVFRETSTPLLDRLKRLIATIPPEERQTPRPLEWFRTRLRGREGRGAHAAELGDALRQLGYTRQRAWSDHENGFRSLWHPPKNLTKE